MVQYQELEIIGFDFNTIILNAAGFYQLGIKHNGNMNISIVNPSIARSAALIGMLSSFIGGCALAPLDLTTASDRKPEYAACLVHFEHSDEVIKSAGVRDAQNPKMGKMSVSCVHQHDAYNIKNYQLSHK